MKLLLGCVVLFCAGFPGVLASSSGCGECALSSLPPVLKEYEDCNLVLLACLVYSGVIMYFKNELVATCTTLEVMGYIIEVIPYVMEQDVSVYMKEQNNCVKKTSYYPELEAMLPPYMKRKDELLTATQDIVSVIMKKRHEYMDLLRI